MIDFDDPGQMMHGGQRIPIDTAEAFEAIRKASMAIYTTANRLHPGRPWDDDAEQQLERRVLNGMTVEAIISATLDDRKARFDE